MKKMYLAIFLVVLVVLVFAGCKSFKGSIETSTTEEDGAASVVSEGESLDVEAEASVLVSQMAEEMEKETDAQGVTVYSPAQISEFVSQEMVTRAPSATKNSGGSNQGGNTPATQSGGNNNATQGGNSGSATQASSNAATQAPATTQAAQQPAQTGKSQYDILRSGTFYAVGTMKDSTGENPLEIAITPNSIYMKTQMDGMEMAVLQDANKKFYMLIPSKKMYMEVNSILMGMMGMSADDLLDVDSLGISNMPALSEADTVNKGEYGGVACDIYTFNATGTSVFMNGNQLLGFESGGSSTYFTTLTDSVPADKMSPPSDYTKSTLMAFMQEMGDFMN